MVVLKMWIQGASLLGSNVWPPFFLCPQVVTRLIHLLGEKILGSLQQGTATGVSWGAPPSWPRGPTCPVAATGLGVGSVGGKPWSAWSVDLNLALGGTGGRPSDLCRAGDSPVLGLSLSALCSLLVLILRKCAVKYSLAPCPGQQRREPPTPALACCPLCRNPLSRAPHPPGHSKPCTPQFPFSTSFQFPGSSHRSLLLCGPCAVPAHELREGGPASPGSDPGTGVAGVPHGAAKRAGATRIRCSSSRLTTSAKTCFQTRPRSEVRGGHGKHGPARGISYVRSGFLVEGI